MSDRAYRFPPRSLVTASELELLRVAVIELDEPVIPGNRTFAEFAARLIGFRVADAPNEERGPRIDFGASAAG